MTTRLPEVTNYPSVQLSNPYIMKKFKHILYTCLFISCISTGCNEYLDVNPAGKVTQTKLFEDIQGYRDAMYGVYANLATINLYGKNLTYGFADQLAQLFTPKATVSEEQTAYNTSATTIPTQQ